MVGRKNGNMVTPLCECGCGRHVKKFGSRFIKGHNSKFMTGEKNSFYGKVHTTFARQCMIYGYLKYCETEKINKKEGII